MGECLRFGIKSVPQTASAWVKRSKARVPFTSWCCNIVIANGSRVMIMGVTYMFNIFIKISRAMSLIYFMKHIKLPNTYIGSQSNLLKCSSEFSWVSASKISLAHRFCSRKTLDANASTVLWNNTGGGRGIHNFTRTVLMLRSKPFFYRRQYYQILLCL